MIKITIENDVIAAVVTAREDISATELFTEVIVPALRLAGYGEETIRDAMKQELE